jgi:hypothetical protein
MPPLLIEKSGHRRSVHQSEGRDHHPQMQLANAFYCYNLLVVLLRFAKTHPCQPSAASLQTVLPAVAVEGPPCCLKGPLHTWLAATPLKQLALHGDNQPATSMHTNCSSLLLNQPPLAGWRC